MLIKTHAIVLHSFKYGDEQMIIDMLTESQGRLSFIVRIPKSPKAKMRKQFFQPLTMIEMEFDYRQRTRLQHIKNVRIAMPFCSIPFHPFKLSISLFIAEFLCYATRGEQINAPLFQYIMNSVEWLDGSDNSFSNFHLVFMMRLSRFLGFFPNLEDYQPGCFFDMNNSCFTPFQPANIEFLRPDEASRISMLMRMNYETMHLFKMSHIERNRITDIIITYYRLHIPDFPDMKSLAVLRELFA